MNEKETVNPEFGSVERHSVAVLKLLKLTRSENAKIRLNAIWCIMVGWYARSLLTNKFIELTIMMYQLNWHYFTLTNVSIIFCNFFNSCINIDFSFFFFKNMTFMWPDEEKKSFLSSLRNDDIFHLIRSHDVDVVMKALGTLRNLISTETVTNSRSHVKSPPAIAFLTMALHLDEQDSVDYVMKEIGRKVMESVVLVLEGDFPVEVKEQVGFVVASSSGCIIRKATTCFRRRSNSFMWMQRTIYAYVAPVAVGFM